MKKGCGMGDLEVWSLNVKNTVWHREGKCDYANIKHGSQSLTPQNFKICHKDLIERIWKVREQNERFAILNGLECKCMKL